MLNSAQIMTHSTQHLVLARRQTLHLVGGLVLIDMIADESATIPLALVNP